MGIVILGRSECPLCGRVLSDGDEIVNFPPLFANQRDPAYEVNDAGVHRACLLDRDYGQRALSKLRDAQQHNHRAKVCDICGRVITDPEDYFSMGPLEDRLDQPLARFNWFQAHLSCLSVWEETPQLVRAITETSRSADWEGDVLERLLDQTFKALPQDA